MLEPNSVVLRTTENVTNKTTRPRRSGAEFNRADAWRFLYTSQAPSLEAWLGALADIPRVLEHSGTLTEVAARYDRITELVEYDAADELDDTELLAALLVVRALRDKLLLDEPRLIAAARGKDVTWTRISRALELKNRQSAERRYLQLRRDLDDLAGKRLTQSERVEAARTQRDRQAEQRWAADHQREIVALARRLAAIDDLQQRADRCAAVTRANTVAALHAHRDGKPDPPLIRAAWPAHLAQSVKAEHAHREAEQQQRATPLEDLMDPDKRTPAPDPALLTLAQQAHLLHQMAGLLSYALDGETVDLSDHPDLVAAIRQLYTDTDGQAPRTPEAYTARPRDVRPAHFPDSP